MPGRISPEGNPDTIEYTATGEYIRAMNAPAEYRDRLPEEVVIKCEYSEDKVTHLHKSNRRFDFFYTIEENNLLVIIDFDEVVWKLERWPEKLRRR